MATPIINSQLDTLNMGIDAQNAILNRIANKIGAYDEPLTWAAVQAQVRAGNIGLYLQPGDQVEVGTNQMVTMTSQPMVDGHNAIYDVAITNENKFISNVTGPGTYVFNYFGGDGRGITIDGITYRGVWVMKNHVVSPGDYGITVFLDEEYCHQSNGELSITVTYTATSYDFDVQGIDEDEPVNANLDHVLSIQSHKVFTYDTVPFDNPQYLFAVTAAACTAFGWPSTGADAGMPAGTYNITLYKAAYNGGTTQDGTYQFTTTQRIPIGGGIRHSTIGKYQSSSYTQAQILNGTFTTYEADTTTAIEEGLLTSEGNGGTNLGTTTASDPQHKSGDYVNFSQRQAHGSNRWKTSYLRQYLNSFDAELNFVPATIWSRNRATKPEGFLHAIEPALRAVIGKVRKRYALPIADGYGYEDVEDYCTLSTMLDLGLGNNNSIAEGPVTSAGVVKRTTAYSFWKGTVQADRIKYQGSAARNWWLGSTYPSNATHDRNVNTSGALYNNVATFANGVVPSLFII